MAGNTERVAVSGEVAGIPVKEVAAQKLAQAQTTPPAPVRKYGDTQSKAMQPAKFKMSDLVGHDIIFYDVEELESVDFGILYRSNIMDVASGERGLVVGNWSVLAKRLLSLQANGELPVQAKITRIRRYFDLE